MLPALQLKNGPTPLDKALSFEEVFEHRNIFCGRYSMCLEVVINRRWPSFTCQLCTLWHETFGQAPAPRKPATILYMPR